MNVAGLSRAPRGSRPLRFAAVTVPTCRPWCRSSPARSTRRTWWTLPGCRGPSPRFAAVTVRGRHGADVPPMVPIDHRRNCRGCRCGDVRRKPARPGPPSAFVPWSADSRGFPRGRCRAGADVPPVLPIVAALSRAFPTVRGRYGADVPPVLPIVAGSVNAPGPGERRRAVEGLPRCPRPLRFAAVTVPTCRPWCRSSPGCRGPSPRFAAVAGLVPTCRPYCRSSPVRSTRPDLVTSLGCRGPSPLSAAVAGLVPTCRPCRSSPGPAERRRAVEGLAGRRVFLRTFTRAVPG